jgi:hypothetical protein
MQPNNPLHLEETGVQASTSAILTKHQEDVLAMAVPSDDDEAGTPADTAARISSSGARPAKYTRLSREQKQVGGYQINHPGTRTC